MSNSATIVAAALDSSKLEQSINELVSTVAAKTQEMANNFTSEVKRMEQAVKNLGSIKIDSGGAADSSISKQTKAQNNATQATDRRVQKEKELNMTLDQGGDILQKVARYASEVRLPDAAKSARESFQAFYKGFNEQARQIEPLIQSWEKLLQARHTGNIEQVAQKIAQVKHEIAELVKEQANLSKSKPQGYMDEIAKRNPQIKALRDQLVSLEAEQQKLKASDPFKDNPYLNTLREKLQGVKSAMNDADTTNRRWLQTTQQLTEAQKKSVDEQMKLFYTRTMKIPTDQYDMQIVKLERIQSMLQSYRRGEVSFTPAQLSGLEKEERTLLSIVGAHREIYQTQQQVSSSTQQTVQSAQRYTEEIRKQAQAIRESQQYQKGERVVIATKQDGTEIVAFSEKRLSLEEQIINAKKAIVEETAKQKKEEEETVQATRLTGEELKKIYQDQKAVNEEINKRANGVRNGGTTPFQSYDSLRQSIASVLGIQEQQVKMANTEKDSYNQLSSTLKQLRQAYDSLGKSDRNSDQGKALVASMHEVERAMQRIKAQATRPVSLESIIGINGKGGLSEKTLDDIAYKMRQLASYRSGLNVETQKKEINTVNQEYDRLKKKMDEVMQKNSNMIASNNALGRSWNYMKNRLAFYFTVGASTQFIKNLIEVRSQYEMNERALGILINSAERGTQIFNELSQMALVSPYTLIELSAAAKQLTAYDIAARDVVDTTRRLADMASAVGVPIDRLTYALGQIKAYGYLNSRDARMFANAGIPLVKQLSDYYTELEGKMVSTADVYDRMKKKAIDYNSVMAVVTKMTDEGGKFFDFQAKMADTLKVRLANLTLAWNNMLNEMGKETQGILTWSIGALRDLFLQWKNLYGALNEVALVLGVAKAFQFLGVCAHAAGVGFGSLNKYMTLNSLLGTRLAATVRTLGSAFMSLVHSPLAWFTMAALLVTEIGDAFINADRATKEFNKSLRDGAKTTYEDLKKFAEQYKNIRDSLYKTETVGNLGGKETTITTPQNIEEGEAKKVWEAMREQIELSSHASDEYISKLLSIENVSERLRQGFQILDDIQTVSAALKEIGEDGIKVTQGWSAWWNAWQGADGLIQNLKDLQKELQRLKDTGSDPDDKFVKVIDKDYHTALERFRKDLKVTTDSVIDFINLNGWSGDTGKIDEVFKQVTDRLATQSNLDPQTAFTLQKDVEIARAKAAKEALEIRIADEKKALATASDEISKQQIQKNLETLEQQKRDFNKFNGENRAYWNDFTKYIKERHISELTAAYNSMTDHGKKAMDFQSEEWQKRVHDWANRYEKSHNLATDSVFNRLRNWINDANTWSVFIKMTISTEDGKSVYKQLEEYDKAADDAWKTMQRLDKRISQLRKKGAKEIEGAETGAIDLSRVSADDKELTEALKERTQAQKDYNNAIEKGGESKKSDAAASKAQKAAESELQKALKEELSIIDKIRSNYQTLTKEGMNHADAIKASTAGYEKSAKAISQTLTRFGLQAFDPSAFAGISDPNDLVRLLQGQLDKLIKSGKAKPAEIKDLEIKVNDIKLDAEKFNLTRITKGLNSELDKLKDEYELALELDANPELGDMFADMFGIDTNTLPQTFGEALDRAQIIINRKLAERKISTPFDLMQSSVDDFTKSAGVNRESTIVKELIAAQNAYRDMFKKNLADSEKMLDDYVKKYGDYSDKIAEIEANRLNQIKKLNEVYYNEELRKRPEYNTKLNAINQGANREKSNVEFDAFKNSRYYTMMFENLDYISTKTIRDMRDRLRELIDSMNDLKPEQLKTLISQYEKLEQKLTKRSPFKTLTKDLKNYLKTSGDRKVANEAFRNAQKEYDAQEKNVAALKEKYEQAKANNNTSQSYLDFLKIEIDGENEILQILKEQLDAAQKKADKYNLTAKLAKSEALAVAQMVATNLKGLAELRDQMNELFGVDASKGETLLGHNIDGMIDSLAKAGNGINKITSSAQSGNAFGVVGGVVDVFTGVGDAIASIFGDGAARTRRLNREINESKETVRQLSMAYDDLERAVNKSLGTAETEARRAAIANKELQLTELERQKTLEESKRSKDRDDDAIKQYEESIHSIKNEIADLKEEVVNNLWGDDVKSAAEAFVDAWVQAWRAGETTLDAIQEKMDEMIYNLIKKAMTSKIVETLLNPLYSELDRMTKEGSEGGMALTTNELRQLATQAGVTAEEINTALGVFYGNLANLGIISPTEESKELSALQQGIQSVSETTANAIEAYLNGMSQQAYLRNDLLTQIRDAVVGFNLDVQVATMSQILLQLQSSYTVHLAIQGILEGWSSPNGLAVRVEMQ